MLDVRRQIALQKRDLEQNAYRTEATVEKMLSNGHARVKLKDTGLVVTIPVMPSTVVPAGTKIEVRKTTGKYTGFW